MLSVKAGLKSVMFERKLPMGYSFILFHLKISSLIICLCGKQTVIFKGLKTAYLNKKEACTLEGSLCRLIAKALILVDQEY